MLKHKHFMTFRDTLEALFDFVFSKKDKFDSLNRSVCASPSIGGSGYAKMQSGLRPFVRFCSITFFCAQEIASKFHHRAQKMSVT
jgi:hypothetical protein